MVSGQLVFIQLAVGLLMFWDNMKVMLVTLIVYGVKIAVHRVLVECGASISGQVYFHKCFICFNYYPTGVSS